MRCCCWTRRRALRSAGDLREKVSLAARREGSLTTIILFIERFGVVEDVGETMPGLRGNPNDRLWVDGLSRFRWLPLRDESTSLLVCPYTSGDEFGGKDEFVTTISDEHGVGTDVVVADRDVLRTMLRRNTVDGQFQRCDVQSGLEEDGLDGAKKFLLRRSQIQGAVDVEVHVKGVAMEQETKLDEGAVDVANLDAMTIRRGKEEG
jgi:hypothetical protein